jgi:hypothetical protein
MITHSKCLLSKDTSVKDFSLVCDYIPQKTNMNTLHMFTGKPVGKEDDLH